MNEKAHYIHDECRLSDKIPEYVLGEMTEPEAGYFTRHVERCLYCREELHETRKLLGRIRRPDAELSEDLTHKILAKIPGRSWNCRRSNFRRIAVLGSAVAVLVCCWYILGGYHSPAREETAAPIKDNRDEKKETDIDHEIITVALSWLAENQNSDGSWDIGKPCGHEDYRVGLTGLTILAFVEESEPTGENSHSANVSPAIEYILRQQNADGLFGPAVDNALYNHGIATLSLLKVQERGWYPGDLKKPIDRAIKYICRSQTPSGGWGYLRSLEDADISLSTWQLQALSTAQSQGWPYLQNYIDRGHSWLRRMLAADGCANFGPAALDYYRLYFFGRTRPQIQAGNPQWNDRIRNSLATRQIRDGINRGSWEPDDEWGKAGGRVYSTVMAILILQVL